MVAELITPGAFRAAMRRLAATVTVVTTAAEERWYGMTATAVTAVAADPPSLLVCINRTASLHAVVERAGLFCVNVLREGQDEIGRDFGGAVAPHDRFARGGWYVDDLGMPRLRDAQAVLACRLAKSTSFETHSIFMGYVVRSHVGDVLAPLLYADGQFSSLARH